VFLRRVLLFLILFSFTTLQAQDLESDLSTLDWEEGENDLALEIGPNETTDENQQKELIEWRDYDWRNLDEKIFLNYREWKKERLYRDESADWKGIWRLKDRPELVGRTLDCVGTCNKYQLSGHSPMSFRSPVREGDEVQTGPDSYAWIYLMEGTMVRVAPNSSVTFQEINIGTKENFLHARINFGNVLWLSRGADTFAETDKRETDTIFIPLNYFEANYQSQEHQITEDNLSAFLDTEKVEQQQYQRLNQLIQENNQWIGKKPTYSFVVMPNGTLWGPQLMAEMVVLTGGESYIQCRSFERYNSAITKDQLKNIQFFFRGEENVQGQAMPFDQWYRANHEGTMLTPYNNEEINLALGEFITERIPTLLVARELLLQQYSKGFFLPNIEQATLGKYYEYRLWGELTEFAPASDQTAGQDTKDEKKNTDLQKRVDFLKEYTRRLETINLSTLDIFRQNLQGRGEHFQSIVYDYQFYGSAMRDYLLRREKMSSFYQTHDRDVLNSTLKPFWKKIHYRRD
jgi:hypothetical protein